MYDMTTIDEQHAELINMFIKLNEVVKNNASREEIYQRIEDVIALTCMHVADEENLMVKSGYPEIVAHKKLHKALIAESFQIKGKYDYVEDGTFIEWLKHWPFGWVLAHIQYADKQFEDHIKQKNNG
jgi:hemerythrin-like metal-binding protein